MNLTIENRAGKIRLNDVVRKDSADKLIDDLEKLYGPAAVAAQMCIGDVVCVADDALETVEVEINTPGGSVFEGQRIYHALRAMADRGVEVTTTVSGIAASMGSVIMLAGDTRNITKGSRVMIHEASSIAMGDAKALGKAAALVESISDEIAELYANRTGGEKEKYREMMQEETWMTAEQSVENGFATAVIGGEKFDTGAKSMSFLSKLIPSAKSEEIELAQAKIDSIQADFAAAQAEVESVRAELATANESIAANIEAIAALDATVTERDASIASMTEAITSRDTQIETLTDEAEVTAEKISTKASELLASQGHKEPLALAESNEPVNSKWEEYQKLKASDPRAAHEFWESNEKEIINSVK